MKTLPLTEGQVLQLLEKGTVNAGSCRVTRQASNRGYPRREITPEKRLKPGKLRLEGTCLSSYFEEQTGGDKMNERKGYPWPASGLTAAHMAVLADVRRKSGKAISQLLAEAVEVAYGGASSFRATGPG